MTAPRQPATPSAAFERIPGTAMRYRQRGTQLEISRRQFENIRAQEAGFVNYSQLQKMRKRAPLGPSGPREYERIARSGLYAVWLRVWSDTHKLPLERLLPDPFGRYAYPEGEEFSRLLAAAIRSGQWIPGGETQNNGDDADMQAILEFIGLRDQNALERMTVTTSDYAIEMGMRRRLRSA